MVCIQDPLDEVWTLGLDGRDDQSCKNSAPRGDKAMFLTICCVGFLPG